MTSTLTFNDGASEPSILDWIRAQVQALEPETQEKVVTYLAAASVGLVGIGAVKVLQLGEVLALLLATAMGVFLQPHLVDAFTQLLF